MQAAANGEEKARGRPLAIGHGGDKVPYPRYFFRALRIFVLVGAWYGAILHLWRSSLPCMTLYIFQATTGMYSLRGFSFLE